MDELIKLHKQVQDLLDKTIMEIGLSYSYYSLSKNESLKNKVNDKVELSRKLESKLQNIEKKIREYKEEI